LSEAEQWQLKTTPCHQVKCRNCGYETSAEGTPQQAIAEVKRLGWELKRNGAWCPECVLQDEMSRDDLGVSPK
jgi:rubredoxin